MKNDVEFSHLGGFLPLWGNWRGLLLFFLIASFLVSCSKDEKDALDESVSQTVVAYMAAENSLSIYATYDLNGELCDADEMLRTVDAMSDNDRLVLFIDDVELPRIYVLTNKTKEKSIAKLKASYQFAEDVNSCSPKILKQVLDWAMTNCSAEEYGLVMWSHGSGWIPPRTPRRAFGVDNGHNVGSGTLANEGDEMDIGEMAKALAGFPKFDFILFDACFMQTVEVCYELKDRANYIIGSPAEIPLLGAPYTTMMYQMFTEKGANPKGMIQCYYNKYANEGCALSVVDCSKLDALADATKGMVKQYEDSLERMDFASVLNYFDYDSCRRLSDMPDYYDMLSLMKHLLKEVDYVKWKAVYDEAVRERLSTRTVYTAYKSEPIHINANEYGGMSMCVPQEKYEGESFYKGYWKMKWNSFKREE